MFHLDNFIHHPDVHVGIAVDVFPPSAVCPYFWALFLTLFRINFSSPTVFEFSYMSEGEVTGLHLAPVPITEPRENPNTLGLGLGCCLLALGANRSNSFFFVEIIGLPRYPRQWGRSRMFVLASKPPRPSLYLDFLRAI